MPLVQLLLPLYDASGKAFPRRHYDAVAKTLAARFGGMTSYTRAPAKGLWKPRPGETQHDDIVVYEVMVDDLDDGWWRRYRRTLERRFEQQELVIRALEMRRL